MTLFALGVVIPDRFKVPKSSSFAPLTGAADVDGPAVGGASLALAKAIAVATFELVTIMGARPGGLFGVNGGIGGNGGVNERFNKL